MARRFDIPGFYRSELISRIKEIRNSADPRRLDLSPSLLELGSLRIKIARHFGFCFGVENAIEIAYRALRENPDQRVYLLSEMIHNPHVNADLRERGVSFIMSPAGQQLVSFDSLQAGDIVIVPAFGTTPEMFSIMEQRGVDLRRYDATCPFVEKVWRRAAQLGDDNCTVIIHGKESHEETRATFAHAIQNAHSLVIRDREEAACLAQFIRTGNFEDFSRTFTGRFSTGFDPRLHLIRLGVVNQTTMLAGETREIAGILRAALAARFGEGDIRQHFADTRDTLCYATSENQESIRAMLESGGDLALVVGGYNSSNTSHLVELCQEKVPTYYIKDAVEILSRDEIRHLELASHSVRTSEGWLNTAKAPLEILLSAGASCPDVLVDQVIMRLIKISGQEVYLEGAIAALQASYSA